MRLLAAPAAPPSLTFSVMGHDTCLGTHSGALDPSVWWICNVDAEKNTPKYVRMWALTLATGTQHPVGTLSQYTTVVQKVQTYVDRSWGYGDQRSASLSKLSPSMPSVLVNCSDLFGSIEFHLSSEDSNSRLHPMSWRDMPLVLDG